jgi:hypothetical protein
MPEQHSGVSLAVPPFGMQHWLFVHRVPEAQAWPHPPQWLVSELVSTQVPPQLVVPLGQQMPLEQLPLGQLVPQLPQLAASWYVLVHAKPPALLPLGQQSGLAPAHALPQAPQWVVVFRAASQPLAALPSQSPYPALQAE